MITYYALPRLIYTKVKVLATVGHPAKKELVMEQTAIRTVNVGIIGLGTVGGGVVEVIQRNHDLYLDAYGIDLRIVRACALQPERAAELGLGEGVFTPDWREVTGCEEADIVVELIGGEHPATEIFEDAFARGKHMVTANKALLGKKMEQLANTAHDAGVQLRCEASCGGGIPIVDTLERMLAGNEMLAVAGILNGTTNYILSRMDAEGLDFGEVLADAQRLGYAEADPTADVDGLDAAAKIAILSSIAFKTRVTSDDVSTVGIRNVSAEDIAYARGAGQVIKLLAVGRKTSEGVEARVQPVLIPSNHQLAGVNGAMNAVFAVGDAVGETMFYGAGAGSLPTASAVVGDILAIADPLSKGLPVMAEPKPYTRALSVLDTDELVSEYFVRATLADAADGEAACAAVLEQAGLAATRVEPAAGTAMFVTAPASKKAVDAAVDALTALDCVTAAAAIRIEDTAGWTTVE